MTCSFSPNGATFPWTSQEEAFLKAFAERCLPWSQVEGLLPGRSVAACETRWNNKLKHQYKVDPRQRLRRPQYAEAQNYFKDTYADGSPIGGSHYVFRVPFGDPYLEKLIQVHGEDKINRDVVLPKSGERAVVRAAALEV